jgi:hypothetical protein
MKLKPHASAIDRNSLLTAPSRLSRAERTGVLLAGVLRLRLSFPLHSFRPPGSRVEMSVVVATSLLRFRPGGFA